MKVKNFISLGVLLFLILGASACSLNNNNEQVNNNLEQADLSGKIIENVNEMNTIEDVQEAEEVVIVIEGSKNKYEDSILINSGDTVYDVLLEASNINKLGLVTKDYDFGKSIDGIGDDLAGTDNKYWLYYVNGDMAMQSIDSQEVKNGDRIELKFEESSM